ncbi:hypothetical protein BDN72DRAFT_840129 [Pluteus cervinus]|uniref:Uncharacterized protein n=1 Tax=Pluteus cervinus TaxID=181527 RepID=A0ACD3AUX9_9AGAR|nr:hypothetical protein BDN72DRAFT_840129 [Pluteus cervinus]
MLASLPKSLRLGSLLSPFRALFCGLLYNLTLRFTLLRLICFCSLTIFVPAILLVSPTGYWVPVLFVHHTISAFGPRFCLPNAIDLMLIFVELGVGWSVVIVLSFTELSTWQFGLCYLVIAWVLIISLTLYGVSKLAAAISLGWICLWSRLDVSETKWLRGGSGASTTAI